MSEVAGICTLRVPAQGEAARAAEAAAREAYGKLLARIVRRTRDIAAAEDALGEAFAKALATWPASGVPSAPEAWLSTVALNRVRDGHRRAATHRQADGALRLLAEERGDASPADERLGLMFAASEPIVNADVHAPLILQTVFGVSVAAMAPAFLLAPSTISQRLVRAKAKIKRAGVPFEAEPEDRRARLPRVLDAIYALLTVAHAASPSPQTRDLATDACALSGLTATLAPDDPEALGLAALAAFSEARRTARRRDGAYVPLSRQDPQEWDERAIAQGDRWLAAAARHRALGPYQLQAAIQSAHCDRRATGRTDWSAIAMLYDALVSLAPSVGAQVGRAVAVAEANGAAAGLAALRSIDENAARDYQPYWAARAHLEARTGREAGLAYARAIALAEDEAVRRHLALRQSRA